jgi:hypothetical protein
VDIASLEQAEYAPARYGWLDRPCALLTSLAQRMRKPRQLICSASRTQSEISHYL